MQPPGELFVQTRLSAGMHVVGVRKIFDVRRSEEAPHHDARNETAAPAARRHNILVWHKPNVSDGKESVRERIVVAPTQ